MTGTRFQAYTNRVRALAGLRRAVDHRVLLVGLCVALLPVAVPVSPLAAQSLDEDYRRGQQAYGSREYAEAAERFERVVRAPARTVDPVVRLEARKYLGASYLRLNRRGEAEEQFEAILTEDPNHELDDVLFSSEVVGVFNAVRNRMETQRERREREEREREAERRRREAERILRERDRVARLEELARQMIVEEESSRWIATIPFGVGQFQNDDEGLGWFFFITETAFLAANVTAAIMYGTALDRIEQLASERRERDDPEVEAANSFEDFSRWFSIASFGALAATMIAGIAEAHASFEPVRTEVRVRELPPDLQPEPEEVEEVEPVLLDPMEAPQERRQKLSLSISPLGLRLRF